MKALKIDLFCSATRRVPVTNPQPVCSDRGMVPEPGDIVVGKLTGIGQHDRLEIAGGREVLLRPGMVCAFVLGRRYSTLEFHGEVSGKTPPGASFHLLSTGGTAGKVFSRNILSRAPTSLEFMGFACSRSGEKLNLKDYRVEAKAGGPRPTVIMVVGADMETGKTTAAASAIRMLSNAGHRTAGVKLTGTTRMKDLLVMKDAGGDPTLDFVDFGFPSTYGASIERLAGIFRDMRRVCGQEGCEYMAVELADGLFQPETLGVLACADVMESVSILIFASGDSVGAYGGYNFLKRLGHTPHFLGGLFTASGLKIDEVASWCPVPILTSGHKQQKQFMDLARKARKTSAPG